MIFYLSQEINRNDAETKVGEKVIHHAGGMGYKEWPLYNAHST